MPLDPQKLKVLLEQAINETGAATNATLVPIGDKLGLYRTERSRGGQSTGFSPPFPP